ncbi:MAG: glyoxylate/hydroxypyruvate reductase A [Sulfurospirillaceae bacterium]|nr:glyoxylate/hydroxypyruvate reductase A [Sulfurospirillaceae bacterium]
MKPIVPLIHSNSGKNASRWLDTLRSAIPFANICEIKDLSEDELSQVEVAIVANPNPEDLLALPNLKWVQSLWAGVERLLAELPNDDVAIVRLIDPQLAETMAEAVLTWTLYLHRDMPEYIQQQAKKEWIRHDLVRASDRTVGILGLGHLGLRAAKRLHDNGFNVIGWKRSKNLTDSGIETLIGEEGLSEIASRSDIIVVLLPLTPQTRGLLDRHFFSALKAGASLMNFARAAIVDEKALLEALNTRKLKHAILDVFLQEPLPKSDPLWMNPNVTILPHISGETDKQSASQVAAKNLKAYFDSGEIPRSVSRETGY